MPLRGSEDRTRITRTVPHTPCIRDEIPHSSSASGAYLPTQEIAVPFWISSSVRIHTDPSGIPPPRASARPRHPSRLSLISPFTSNSNDETGLLSRAVSSEDPSAYAMPASPAPAARATHTAQRVGTTPPRPPFQSATAATRQTTAEAVTIRSRAASRSPARRVPRSAATTATRT